MATTTEILTAICPGAAADPNLTIFQEIAAFNTSASYWGTRYALALALRIAHIWSLSQRPQGAVGNVSSMTEGKLSISYSSTTAKSGAGDSELGQTTYGRQLQNMMSGGISVTGGGL
jgi:hypothetical protein